MSDETLRNRKAGMALIHEAALHDGICAAYFEFESFIRQMPGGSFLADTEIEYSDDDWDDVRPY